MGVQFVSMEETQKEALFDIIGKMLRSGVGSSTNRVGVEVPLRPLRTNPVTPGIYGRPGRSMLLWYTL